MVVGSRQSSNDCIFYPCTLFQGKTEEVRDLRSDTSAYLLKRVSSLNEGLRARCYFSFFFFPCYSSPLHSTLLIRDHAYSPWRVLRRFNSSPQVQVSGVLHFFSSCSISSPFLLFALLPCYLLVSLPVRHPSFYVLPTPYAFRSSLSPSHNLYLYFGGSRCSRSRLCSFSPSFSLTFYLHMQVLILKSWPTTDIQY